MAEKEKNPFARFLTHYGKGQVLFSEGDDGEEMYIVEHAVPFQSAGRKHRGVVSNPRAHRHNRCGVRAAGRN